jgi:hypothetical protein
LIANYRRKVEEREEQIKDLKEELFLQQNLFQQAQLGEDVTQNDGYRLKKLVDSKTS